MKHFVCAKVLFAGWTMVAADFPATAIFIGANRTSRVNAPITDQAGNRLSGERYRVLIYGGVSVERLMPVYTGSREVMKDVGLMTGADAGYFLHLDYIQSPRFDNQGNSWLQVRAWDSTLGDSYEAVVALGVGGYGQSEAFISQGLLDSDFLGVPRSMIGLKSFSIAAIVPEPGTLALLVLGGGVLVSAARGERSKKTRGG